MPFDCAHLSNLHSKLPCQVPPYPTIQCHPLPLPQPLSYQLLCRQTPLNIHSKWIWLKTYQIPIHRLCFEVCLFQYVEYSMMVLGDMMLPERVDMMKFRKDYNISSLLVFLVSTLFLSLAAASRMFESDSILLQTRRKILTTHSPNWLHSPPSW